ncbi:hypothetical protein [Klebsiella michiganensis]|uniref:hypothetical protein n=1 Tax=Klebsiella michiganensis TaxID=1134687 RepID=UPI002541BFBE|nr:hypothetical protein [Klebsiella michiganensis]MDK3051939.1 hypothetical protein [Klebsiella michiganensis]
MKTTLQKVKDGIAAALLGKTPEQLADEQRNAAVKNAVGDFLKLHPADYLKPAGPKAATTSPVTKKRVMKSLGAGAGTFTPHIVDEEALRRACEAARAFQAADPERYSHIIESAPLRA